MTKVCLLMLDLIFSVGSIGTRGRRGFRGLPLAQNSNVFQRQAEARLQFGVIDVDEPLADSFLTRIVAGLPEARRLRCPIIRFLPFRGAGISESCPSRFWAAPRTRHGAGSCSQRDSGGTRR